MIRVSEQPLDPWREIVVHQDAHPELAGRYGATAVFVGTMRNLNEGVAVEAMTLEHYPAMTGRELERIRDQAMKRWDLLDALVVHRVGRLQPDDPIVLVAVWSAHRDAAFAACRHLIDELKTRAPFWKKERTSGGERWVEPGKK
ncbi:MAG: molybdenum cofactor biosynthesis protein MoaE [Pseudomonadota bacterium]